MPAVIAGYARSPFTPAKKGALARTRPDDIAAAVVDSLLSDLGIEPSQVDDLVVGCANNQLLPDADGDELHRRGILYAPDYVVNAGGIINVEAEIGSPYNPDRARERTERIYDIMENVISVSKTKDIPTYQAADLMAEERLTSVQNIKKIYSARES